MQFDIKKIFSAPDDCLDEWESVPFTPQTDVPQLMSPPKELFSSLGTPIQCEPPILSMDEQHLENEKLPTVSPVMWSTRPNDTTESKKIPKQTIRAIDQITGRKKRSED